MIKHHEKVESAVRMLFYLAEKSSNRRETTTRELQCCLTDSMDERSKKSILTSIRQCNDTFPNLINLYKADTYFSTFNDRNFYYVSLNVNVYSNLVRSIISGEEIVCSSTSNFGVNTNDNLYLTFRVLQIILDEQYCNGISFIQLRNITQSSLKQLHKIITTIENIFCSSISIRVNKPKKIHDTSHYSNWIVVKNRDYILKKLYPNASSILKVF